VGALFATANRDHQGLIGLFGFMCEIAETFIIAATPRNDTREEKTDDEHRIIGED
jgi:hypothetical protein